MDPKYREWLMRILLGKVCISSVSEDDVEAAAVFAASFGIAWPFRYDDLDEEPAVAVAGGAP